MIADLSLATRRRLNFLTRRLNTSPPTHHSSCTHPRAKYPKTRAAPRGTRQRDKRETCNDGLPRAGYPFLGCDGANNKVWKSTLSRRPAHCDYRPLEEVMRLFQTTAESRLTRSRYIKHTSTSPHPSHPTDGQAQECSLCYSVCAYSSRKDGTSVRLPHPLSIEISRILHSAPAPPGTSSKRTTNLTTVAYSLGIYLLNLFLAFLSPKFDPALEQDEGMEDGNASGLPTKEDQEFRPFVRRLPEFKFWYSTTKAIAIGFFCSWFEIFNLPVFWPVLVVYWLILFGLTSEFAFSVK